MGPVSGPSLWHTGRSASTPLPALSYAHLAQTLRNGALHGVALLALTWSFKRWRTLFGFSFCFVS